MTVSLRTEDSMIKIIKQGLKAGVTEIVGDTVDAIVGVQDVDLSDSEITRIALTVAGIDFKIIVVLHYSSIYAKESLASNANNADGGGNESDLENYFLEAGNRFCGEVKRLLYESFDHLGMSTPCQLSKTTTLNDIRDKNLQGESHVAFKLGEEIVVGASIYMFAEGEIDFSIDSSVFEEDSHAGELEFF